MAEQEKVSVRGLVDSEFGTPLREFKGRLKEYYPEERQYGETGKGATVVVLNFIDVEAIHSVEPYNFPIATLSIKLSNKKRSGWGIFSDSVAECISADQDLPYCVDKMMHLRMEEGHVYGQNRESGEDMVGNPWHVLEIEGAAAGVGIVSAKDRAKELIVGKTRADFNKAAYADTIIRKDPAFQRAITDKSFIKSLLQLGEIVEDENGVFHLPTASAPTKEA